MPVSRGALLQTVCAFCTAPDRLATERATLWCLTHVMRSYMRLYLIPSKSFPDCAVYTPPGGRLATEPATCT